MDTNLKNLQVTIVGLGLMGGSLGMALRPFITKLTAVDPNQQSLDAALKAGAIDWGTADLSNGLSEADVVIIATPIRTIIETLNKLSILRPDGCLVLDLGSTKSQVCETMNTLPTAFQTIGGHPMCGKESSGFEAADPDLYRERTFVLCRTERTTAEIERVGLSIVEAVGGRPLFLPPKLHDELVSLTSHLPYLISSLLMRQAVETAQQQENLWQVSASGFKDTSRLSGSSPAVMGDILSTNRTAVLAQLGRYRQAIDELITLLKKENDTQLLSWLEKAQEGFQNYKTFRRENS